MNTPFLSIPGQASYYAVSLLFLLQPIAKEMIAHGHAPAVRAKFGIASAVFVMLFVNVLVVAWLGNAGVGLLPDWTYYLGLALALLASATYFWGHQSLGRYFSSQVVVYQGHQLVERGPYRFVRHPMYAGVLLLSVGLGLMAQSWAGLAYSIIATSIVVGYRIRVEEQALIAELGDQYVSYTKRVKRLIPFLL